MTMEDPPFEYVFPIENGGFYNVMLVFRGVLETLPPTPFPFRKIMVQHGPQKTNMCNMSLVPLKTTMSCSTSCP